MTKGRQDAMAEAIDKLKQAGYRLTRPRQRLLEMVLAKSKPFTAPELVRDLSKSDRRSIDMVTVYRSIPVFEKLDIVRKCDFSEGVTTYEVSALVPHGHHHHIVCQKCKRVEALDFCVLEGQERLLEKMGYTSLRHKLEFVGVCPRCSR